MKAVGIIPARWASVRFPGKVLALLHGKPLIEHVWRQAKQAKNLDEVYIACDEQHVKEAAEKFGAKTVLTNPELNSGTDRVAKAAEHLPHDVILNIQGDEPLVSPEAIDRLADCLLKDKTHVMATVVKPLTDVEEIGNPNVVKAVLAHDKTAIYFSRSTIPFNRDKKPLSEITYYKHLGLYAYRKSFLRKFKDLPVSDIEFVERLEQLRVLQAGYRIITVETTHDSIGVDTPEDLEKVAKFIEF